MKGTVVLLDAFGGVASSCSQPIPGVFSAETRSRVALAEEEELVEVPLEIARKQRGHPRKLRP